MILYIFIGVCLLIWLVEFLFRIPKISNLSNKYVLITGCDSGFGNELAIQLDGKGIHVIASCLTEKARNELGSSLSQRSSAILMNVADHGSVQEALNKVREVIPKSEGLWGLVNNAGITGYGGAMEWWSRDEYKRVLDVNLFGLIDVTKVFTPMLKQGRGRIVNVASICGRVVMPEAGYCISKFGVECFSDEIRVQLKAFGISVCIIEPGFFRTSLTDGFFAPVRAKWAELSPETRQEFGGQEVLESRIARVSKSLDSLPSRDTGKVVNSMEHALTAKYPKKRYSVGYDAKLYFIPLSYMPSVVTDFLFRL
ncbi:retinol dehydrogenase 16-like [Antedon mediterranea]|uniref:retinol dehydrogenase 16-like n=1 Tax=Antedon mediterranea TaxID=105859 RepID=UPI003AF9ED0F